MNEAKQDVLSYSKGFKYLHWLVAVLVFVMLGFGFFLSDLPSDMKPTAYMLHKSTGLTILALMLIRSVWVCFSGKPKLPLSVAGWECALAAIVQWSLYVFLILMALSGWLMATASNKIPVYFGLFPVPFPGILVDEHLSSWMYDAHGTIAWILLGLLFLHILGALKHGLIQKDDVLKRMLP